MIEIPTYQIGIFVYDLTFSIEKNVLRHALTLPGGEHPNTLTSGCGC